MGGVFADDFRHPTTFRQAIGLRGLLHLRQSLGHDDVTGLAEDWNGQEQGEENEDSAQPGA